ncbi:hypothetical protein [Pantoea sp. A4]|uniref:hypothetical protein n=1 Tax=Pantoea sp. A4 TaxID=1225184 RepID=UPI00036ED5AD|nr:hypothetical protein [Pantoea sp. A4]
MNDKKMISIDQFTPDERLVVEETLNGLVEKFRQRSGKEPDDKKRKELSAEARQQIMAVKLAKEKAAAEKKNKPVRKKKPASLAASEVSDFSWSASINKGRRQ